MIGNSLEILESINILNNIIEEDVKTLLIEIGSELINVSKLEQDKEKAKELIKENIENGKSLKKFKEIIKYQGGNPDIIDNINSLNISKKKIYIKSKKKGYINYIKTKQLGNIVKELGGGRNFIEEKIDNSVGIEVLKKIGDHVKYNEEVCIIYYNKEKNLEDIINKVEDSFLMSEEKKEKEKTILEIF